MESYNLVSQGTLLPGCLPENAMAKLTALKVPEALAQKLVLEQQPCILKRQSSLHEVKRLQTRFESCGLATAIELKLSPECLSAGLSDTSAPTELATEGPLVLALDQTLLEPAVLSLASSSNLQSSDRSRKAVLQKIGYSWNPILLTMAVLLIAVHCEMYLIRALSSYLHLQGAAGVLGILFLVVAVGVLPRLLQPLSAFVIRYGSSAPRLILQDNSLHPAKKRYQIIDGDKNLIATVVRGASTAEYLNGDGKRLYTWSRAPVQRSNGEEEVKEAHNNAVSDEITGLFGDYLRAMTSILAVFRSKPAMETCSWDDESGTAITACDGNTVAIVFNEPFAAIKIFRSKVTAEQEVDLVCFAITITRSAIA